MGPGLITFRTASVSDSARVAELHAVSWRSAYRGFLSDAYLDGDILEERGRLWEQRLAQPSERQYVLLAEKSELLVGFVCVLLDEEPAWGAYLDNLHVRPADRGKSLGRRLLSQALLWVAQVEPGKSMHLLVFEGNTAARRFYERHGGALVETLTRRMPDGGTPRVVRYRWHDPTRLLATVAADS